MHKTKFIKPTYPNSKKRIEAIDVMRGITVAAMLLVNNPGSWSEIYAPLRHAPWNGLTPTDLIFPFFMFIMGFSSWFAMRRFDFQLNLYSFLKIIKRAVLLILIGWAISWFGRTLRGVLNDSSFFDAALNFSNMRLPGVFPRLGVCYGVGCLLAMIFIRRGKNGKTNYRPLLWLTGVFLFVYSLILIFGEGYEFSERNIIYVVDNALFGPDHLYADTVDGVTLKLDPEGLLSTIPSIAHMIIGFACAGLTMELKDADKRINRLFIIGTILVFAGFLLDYGLPINKKIWSPTFVMTTCGLAALTLGLLIWIIDIKNVRSWTPFFKVYGTNPLFLFCLGSVTSIVMGAFKTASGLSLTGAYYTALCDATDNPTFASLLYALSFVIFIWLIGLILYRKKIFIKI